MIFKKKTIKEMVKSGDLTKLKKFLTEDNVNDILDNEFTALYYAVENEKSKVAKMLLEMGASINISGDESVSIMDVVVRKCNENVWSVFLEAGHVLSDTIDGQPIIHWLLTQKYYCKELLNLLLNNGFDINTLNSNGMTALAYIVSGKDFSSKAFDHILEAGIDVNYASSSNSSPFIVALENRELPCTHTFVKFNFKDILANLKQYGLDLNTRKIMLSGGTLSPAICAMQQNKPSRFIALLDAGLPISKEEAQSLLGYLDISKFNSQMRRELIKANEKHGNTVAIPIAFYDKWDQQKVIEKLAKQQEVSITLVKEIALNAEHSFKTKVSMITPLLECGVDLNEPIKYAMVDMTLLCAVVGWSDQLKDADELIQWLCERGATIEAGGYSAFLSAIWFNKYKLAQLLLARGAQVDFIDIRGMSAESMILTASPRGDRFDIFEDMAKMITLVLNSYEQIGKPYPHDRLVVSGTSVNSLTRKKPFIASLGLHSGDGRRILTEAYLESDWDINRKYADAYLGDKTYNLTLFDHMNLNEKTKDEDLIYMLQTYPNIKCGTAEDRGADTLRSAINSTKCAALIEMIIERHDNINRILSITYINDDVVKSNESNYIIYTVTHGGNLEVDIEEKTAWTHRILRALIKAGCDVNFIMKFELLDAYKNTGHYRNEVSCIERVAQMWADEPNAGILLTELLLDNGARVSTQLGYYGESYFHLVCGRITDRFNEFVLRSLKLIESRGMFDVNSRSNNGGTPLLHAVNRSKIEVVKWLIEQGADIMAIGGFDQSTAVNRAISNFNDVDKQRRLECVKILLNAGADIDYIDKDGDSPLSAAVRFGCFEIVKELVSRGADLNIVNTEGESLIHIAAKSKYAYDLCSVDNDKYTPEEALELRLSIISFLTENGVDIDASQEGNTSPLIAAILNNDVDIFKVLTKCGADSNRVDTYGRTAAMMACRYGDFGFVNTLFMRKKTGDIVLNIDIQGLNLIHYAALRNVDENDDKKAKEFIEIFIDRMQIPIINTSKGISPLHFACNTGKIETVKKLIEAGCDVNCTYDGGVTPLMSAAGYSESSKTERQEEIIKILIDNGADITLKNTNGDTAADFARTVDFIDDLDELNCMIATLEGGGIRMGFN